ncbi:MAG: HRDC domain-containing protein [Acidimicrobiales bacterium]|nr:HRDC domain-containing protein [Acidimicrobiales bacterium]
MRSGASDSPTASHRWIDTDDDLTELVEALSSTDVFGVDTEFHREKTYYPKLALVQIAWDGEVVLVDPLAIDIAPLAAALEGPAVVVMHAASQDLEVLQLACDTLPRELFDTQIAAAFVGHSLPSLANLVDRFYGTHLPKGDRLTDWLRRPLGADQRAYAANDVEYLLSLREDLIGELTERGRLDWATGECELLRRRGFVARDPEDAWSRIKEARSLRGEAAAVARSVAAWRERRAASLDQPVRFVLSDLAVVGVAQRRPKTLGELARIRGVDERHARGSVGEGLLEAVAEGRDREPPRVAQPSHELDRRLRPAVSLVAAWVGQLARDMSIETSMVATRSDIEALLAGAEDARLLDGWRAELVGDPIRRLVAGEASLAFDGKGNLLLEPRTAR